MRHSLIYVRPCAGKRVPLERDPSRYLDPAGQVVERNQHWLRRLAAGDVEVCESPAPQQAAPEVRAEPVVEPATDSAPAPEPELQAATEQAEATVKNPRKRTTTRGDK